MNIPIDILKYIRSFLSIHDVWGTHHLNESLQNMYQSVFNQQLPNRTLHHFPKYYEKINLKNQYKLRWKRYDDYFSEFYYRHSKDFFQYKISIQNDYHFYCITILPQWQPQFTPKQTDILDEYFYKKYSGVMTNINNSFAELIYRQTLPDFSHYSIQYSPRYLFQFLDDTVFNIKQDLDKIQTTNIFRKSFR